MAHAFDGKTFNSALDGDRLTTQLDHIRLLMADGQWRTLPEIRQATGGRYSETSISARLRDLRKPRFGRYVIEHRRRKGRESRGVWEYRMAGQVQTETQSRGASQERAKKRLEGWLSDFRYMSTQGMGLRDLPEHVRGPLIEHLTPKVAPLLRGNR